MISGIGLAKQNITPPFPMCLACSQKKDTLFERIHDEIFIRCAILTNETDVFVVISYDLLFHSRELYDFVYDYVSAKINIKKSDILINYSHDHNAPSVLGYNDFSASSEYENLLKAKTKQCIDDAISAVQSCSMEYGVVPGNWNINRRRSSPEGIKLAPNPDGPVDENLYILKFLSDSGDIIGMLINYACHPVHYPDTLGLTSEYPGFLCRYIEEEIPGCLPIFIQGAGADARPLGTSDGDHFSHKTFHDIDEMAISMKQAILSSLKTKIFRPVEPSFSSVSFSVEIPTDDEGPEYFEKNTKNKDISAHLRRNAEYVHKNHSNLKDSFTLHCGMLKIADNLIIAHMGGEPVCQVKFNVDVLLTGYDVIFAGYTDACAYIVTDKMINEGGYEVNCFLEYMHKGIIKKGIDKLISTAFTSALDQLS